MLPRYVLFNAAEQAEPDVKEVVEKAPETPSGNKKKRILVVEDESTTRLFMLNQLKKAGLEVDTAANGGIALKKLKEGHFDAVMLDLMLSGIKGQDLIREIRKKEDLANLPIFVVTSAQRMDPWRKRGSKAGATRVFDKAAPIEKIVAEIVAHLSPRPKGVAEAKDKEERAWAIDEAEIPDPVPEMIIKAAPAAGQTPKPAAPAAQGTGSRPFFTPLPSGRETGQKPAPAVAPTTSAPAPVPAAVGTPPREIKTGFFRNPDSAAAPATPTNTALLRKAAKAGQAARGTPSPSTPAPILSGDTPLHIPPLSDAAPVSTSPAAPAPPAEVQAETSPAPEPPKERVGLAERIIAPFKIFASRSDSSTVYELKEQLAEVSRNRDELLVLLRDHPIFGPPSAPAANTEGLQEAKAAASRAEAAYQAELARSRQFEEELKRIREARDELNRRLAEEEKAAAESRRRSKELEERLTQSASELDHVKAELQKHIGEHSKLEAELRRQLNSTRESADTAKVAYQEQAARAARSTEELAALRRAREELNARLNGETQAAAESRRRSEEREQQLRQKEAEVERLKVEIIRRAAQSGSVRTELTEKLTAAEAAAQHAEAACREEAGRRTQFENELARLNQAREELNGRLAREERAAAEVRRRSEEMERQLAAKTAELERVKGELDRHAEERKSLESQLQQQVAAANAATEQARRQFQEETSLSHRSKEEVNALRRARDELNTRLEREQHAAAESRRRGEELEGKLQASARELTHLRSELEKHVNERAALVTASSRQLNAAKAAATKAEKAYQEQLKRSAKFERELAALREDRTQLDGQLKSEQKSTATSQRKIMELEKHAAAHAAELEKARAQFEKQLSEHQRLESEHRSAREASLQARTPESTNDPGSAEARFRESISALARVTAQLEKERGERRRIEQRTAFLSSQLENLHEELRKHLEVEKETQQRLSEFERQLREREDEVTKAVSDFQKEEAARQLAEAQLKAKGDMGSQLQERFNLLDEAKQVFNSAQEKLEARLGAALAAHKQSEARLQAQISERKRVEELLEVTQHELQEQAQQNVEEISRLQSTLELETIERRKQESQSLQSRYASLDASRLGRAFVNSFRTHLRPSADQLLQATRRLLELPLEDQYKKLVEDALENALLLQTSMQDDMRLPGETDTGEAAEAA